MEVEFERRIEVVRNVEMKKVQEEETVRFDRKINDLRELMESRMKDKIKNLRMKEQKVDRMAEDGMKLVEGQRY